ncbi:hypothetical protein CQA44_08625 [Helicobacter sp. MIT 14-3879]|nr:hypothetical protein CQA44_08625 [Helicobacter sp. MIT 14-3879]
MSATFIKNLFRLNHCRIYKVRLSLQNLNFTLFQICLQLEIESLRNNHVGHGLQLPSKLPYLKQDNSVSVIVMASF